MRLHVDTFAVPKAGNSDDEYEDASYPLWHNRERSLGRGVVRVAVADGATEGSFSRQWAEILVRSFCRSRTLRFDETFARAQREWDLWLEGYCRDRERNGKPMLWYEEAKLEQGAFATLLGLQFRSKGLKDPDGHWTAVVLGDSCLFQIRGDQLAAAFPLERSDQFSTSPSLVPSRPADTSVVIRRAAVMRGKWRAEDAFYLATDALAAWFLGVCEEGGSPWHELRDLGTDHSAPFAAWVQQLRRERRMRNDDVTLLRIDIY
jgi:hypothetical protein